MATIMRVREVGEFPPVVGGYCPSDYVHLSSRGTIEYSSSWKNYSYHTVTISAGITLSGCNFSQLMPATPCISIEGTGTLTFVECNMSNVALDPLWVLEDCNTSQSWVVTLTDPDTNEEYESNDYICSHPDDLPDPLTPPSNAVTTRTSEDITFDSNEVSGGLGISIQIEP